jgi:DNA-binding transcriptional LysR family regulator
MDVIQTLRCFVAVAQSGSFTAAADVLDTTTTNVSKAVSSLETRLHTRLINRTTRRLALTEAGVRYLQRAEKFLMTCATPMKKPAPPRPCRSGV